MQGQGRRQRLHVQSAACSRVFRFIEELVPDVHDERIVQFLLRQEFGARGGDVVHQPLDEAWFEMNRRVLILLGASGTRHAHRQDQDVASPIGELSHARKTALREQFAGAPAV
jgi:hypothetical protein